MKACSGYGESMTNKRQSDKTVKVSEMPKLTITMRPETKARLEALRSINREPAWKIIDDALEAHFKSLSLKDRRALEMLSERISPE